MYRCSATTKVIAEAVAEGLSSATDVKLVEVGAAPEVIGEDVALLVVGGPTHAFGLSRPGTRQDAATKAEHGLVSKGIGLREWLAAVRPQPGGVEVAAFDTRVDKPRVPGSAARAAARRLRRLGLRARRSGGELLRLRNVGPAAGGRDQRARQWAEKLGSAVTATQPDQPVS
jgi:hypothetical protein